MMLAEVVVINEGTNSQVYKLAMLEDGKRWPIPYSPEWKTKRGAMNWAKKKGYLVVV